MPQHSGAPTQWRMLHGEEIQTLQRLGSLCDDWSGVRVTEGFNPRHVRNCVFEGAVRLGPVAEVSGSRLRDCDIGARAVVRDVRELACCDVAEGATVFDVGTLAAEPGANFGCGCQVRVANENGGRSIRAFEGMTGGDALLWSRSRGDGELLALFEEMTGALCAGAGRSHIGAGAVVRHCHMLQNVRIGTGCELEALSCLRNVTLGAGSGVSDGASVFDSVVGRSCRVSGGARVLSCVLGDAVTIKLGARVVDTYVGDNSTIACCEVLSCLLLGGHEQHHNNSFLIACTLMGQSNIAAGATIGSNHNSRAADGEVIAGRGFWPGLCTSVKHPSRFASHVLLAKGDYPYELDIPLPQALVSNDVSNDRLLVMPAYWWMYNMYALARNAFKLRQRDRRPEPRQTLEFDYLAPDTVEEMLRAMSLLERWVGQAAIKANPSTEADPAALGRELLSSHSQEVDKLQVLAEGVENSRRAVVVLKPAAAWAAYRQMVQYYAVRALGDEPASPAASRCAEWVNLGGLPTRACDVRTLLDDVKARRLSDWAAVHRRADELGHAYPAHKRAHALACLTEVMGAAITPDVWRRCADEAADTARHIAQQVRLTRKKDYDDPFRQITFADAAERDAVMGKLSDNEFVRQMEREAASRA
jgi:carbonic anhydrase/acetyltransferase-like protein (isoleucine patch superfamily)